jgi:tetratricopeptide (TPR) repeat protein
MASAQVLQQASSTFTNVYVERFQSPAGTGADVARFATEFVRFELTKMPQLRVVRIPEAPPCGNAPSRAQGLNTSSEGFHVRGILESNRDTSSVLDVEVTLCRDGTLDSVAHETRLVRTRTATSDLQLIASAIAEHLERRLLPAVLVSIVPRSSSAPAQPQRESPIGTLRERITSAIVVRSVARPVDGGAADYTVEAIGSGTEQSPSSFLIRVRALGGQVPFVDSVRVPRGRLSMELFLDSVASTAAIRLGEDIHAPTLHAAAGAALRDSSIARVRSALCLGETSPCRPSVSVASALLDAVPPDRNDPSLLALRGQLDLLRGSYGAAIAEFRRADSLRARGAASATIPEANAYYLGIGAASAYRAAGNHSAAVRELQRLESQFPNDTTIVLLQVQSLRLSGRPWDALDAGSKALGRGRDNAAIRTELGAVVRDFSLDVALDNAGRFRGLCRRDTEFARDCALAVAAAAERLTEATSTSRVRAVATFATELGALERRDTTSARIAVAMAGAALGRILTVDSSGTLSYSAAGGAADVFNRFSAIAQAMPLTDSLRAKLARTRAMGDVVAGDYARASARLDSAFRIIPNRADALAAATLGRVAVEHARLRHAVDTATVTTVKALLASAVNELPDDDDVLLERAHFCNDFAIDLECSFVSDSIRIARGRAEPSTLLDAIEAAVLTDRPSVAMTWLQRVSPKVTTCHIVVMKFYTFWTGNGDARTVAFNDWRQAMTKIRASPERCWLFDGAKARLHASPAIADAPRLLAMIAAYESPAASIPPTP